jgi:eukaryotic-like serine/threonine-protein kinase
MRHSTVVFFETPMVGKTLGKYRILEKIGRGGMGVVYLGVDETLDRHVAIKAISPELVEEDLVRRFRAEAVMLAKVNHPNIAMVYELFRDDDRLLMVMELVRGQTFEQLMEHSGPIPVERAAALAGQILDALGHAHRAGIVHRDLKPANLMLTDAGIVKVMDFGIARISGTERMTSDGFMVGTPAYMAPEQVRGDEVDGRADLYAAGVVFYRMLTGKLPFKAETAVAMINSQLNERPISPRDIRTDLPEWLDAVLMRSLAKRPADRYQSADEFRRALNSIDAIGTLTLPDDLTVATPVSPMAVSGSGVSRAPAMSPATGPHATTLVLNRSHLAVAGGFGAILLLVVGLLAWVALRSPGQTPLQVVTVPSPAAAPPDAAPAVPASAPEPPRTAVVVPEADLAPATPPQPKPVPPQPQPKPQKTAPPAAPVPAAGAPSTAPLTARPVVPAADQADASTRGGRGTPGAVSPSPATSSAEFHPTVVPDLRAVAVIDGRSSRIVEALVTFSEKSITASDSRNGQVVKTFPYSAVAHATVSRSRKPRGAGGVTVETPGGIPEGNIFSRGARLWVTLETRDDRLILRLDQQQLKPVLDLVGERTLAPIERYMDPEK